MKALDPDNLTTSQLTVIAALLNGESQAEAGARGGVARTTVSRWLNEHHAFKDAYKEGLDAIRSEVTDRTNGLANEALDVVRSILNDRAAPANVRLQAAKVLLDRLMPAKVKEEEERKVNSHDELMDRIDRLAAAAAEEEAREGVNDA
jgi:transposase